MARLLVLFDSMTLASLLLSRRHKECGVGQQKVRSGLGVGSTISDEGSVLDRDDCNVLGRWKIRG